MYVKAQQQELQKLRRFTKPWTMILTKELTDQNQTPIQWVRVHNLPDLAYFNHAQHYVVGKVACQTCHGPVEDSMTVAGQYSPLTMGWCINCHRTTKVNMAGNAYYNDFHKQLLSKYGADSLLTVQTIGGLECARCHYYITSFMSAWIF